MKYAKIPVTLIFLLVVMSSAMAQQNPVINKKIATQFNIMLADMKQIDATKPAEVKRAIPIPSRDQIFDETLSTLNAEIEQGRMDIEKKNGEFVQMKAGHSAGTNKDLMALVAGIPEPITSLPDAKKAMNIADEKIIYNIYIEKLKRLQDQYIEEARKYALNSHDANQISTVAQKNADQAMQDLKNNSVIQQAGGLEKLQQMTPAEREAWGKKMAEQVRNNPSAYTSNNYDPAKSAQIKAAHNEASLRMAITQRTTEILNHRKQLAEIAGTTQKRTDDYFVSVNRSLNNQYARFAAALPVVEHGEAGKGKDTYPVDLAYNLILYSVERENALSDKEVWKNYVEAIKVTFAEYNVFLSEYWGRDKQTDQLMASQNQTPPAIMAGALGELIQLTQMAKSMTHSNAGWQRNYDEKILHLYESVKN